MNVKAPASWGFFVDVVNVWTLNETNPFVSYAYIIF